MEFGPPDSFGPPSLAPEVEVRASSVNALWSENVLQSLIRVGHNTSATSQMVDIARHLESVRQILHQELLGNLLYKR